MEFIDINQIVAIAEKAGQAILDIYNDPLRSGQVETKSDNSPLTLADRASNEVIAQGLASLYPQIPILSEEGKEIPFSERKNWNVYWCVDPLDGTKEFVKRNGEFTVNIALMENNHPVAGVIHIPVNGDTYYGTKEQGARKKNHSGEVIAIHASTATENWLSVGSRSHGSDEEANILSKYPITEQVSVGSSIKFCFIAEGKANIYYRHGPTMEWDTAAGQAILEISGGTLTTPDGSRFLYNKELLLNGGFLCLGAAK